MAIEVASRPAPARPRKSSKRGRPATSAAKRSSLKASPTLERIPASPLPSPVTESPPAKDADNASLDDGAVEIGPPCEDKYTQLPPSFSSRYMRSLAQQKRRKASIASRSQFGSKSTMSSSTSGFSLYEDATEGDISSDDDRGSVKFYSLKSLASATEFTPKLHSEAYLLAEKEEQAAEPVPPLPTFAQPTKVIPLRRHSSLMHKPKPHPSHARHQSESSPRAAAERPLWHPKPLVLTPRRTAKAPITHRPAYLQRPSSASGTSVRLSRTASSASSSSLHSSSVSSGSYKRRSLGYNSESSLNTDVSSRSAKSGRRKSSPQSRNSCDGSFDDSERSSCDAGSDKSASPNLSNDTPDTSLEPLVEEKELYESLTRSALPKLEVETLPRSPPLIGFSDPASPVLAAAPRRSSSRPHAILISASTSPMSGHFSPPTTPPPDAPLPTLPLFHPDCQRLSVHSALRPPSIASSCISGDEVWLSAPSSPYLSDTNSLRPPSLVDDLSSSGVSSPLASPEASPALDAENLNDVLRHLQLRKSSIPREEAPAPVIHSTIVLPSTVKKAKRPSVASTSTASDDSGSRRPSRDAASSSLVNLPRRARSWVTETATAPRKAASGDSSPVPASRRVPMHQMGLEPRGPRVQLDVPDPIMRDLLNSSPPRAYVSAPIAVIQDDLEEELVISMPSASVSAVKLAARPESRQSERPVLAITTPSKKARDTPMSTPKISSVPPSPVKRFGRFFGISAKPATVKEVSLSRKSSRSSNVSRPELKRTQSRSSIETAPRLATPELSMINLNQEWETQTFALDDLYAKLDAFESEILSPAHSSVLSPAPSTPSSIMSRNPFTALEARPTGMSRPSSESLTESLLDSIRIPTAKQSKQQQAPSTPSSISSKMSVPTSFKAALRAQALERW